VWDMSGILAEIPLALLGAAVAVALVAGFVKGAVGFAMPMIMISGLGSFLPAETALAALILPTVVTNGLQALRQGWRAAWDSDRRFRLFLGILLACLLISAQFVRILPQGALFLLIGLPVTAFAVLQLAGWRLRIDPAHRTRTELLIGGLAGGIGGLSGVWGPPTVAYLTALGTPKAEHVRVQGVVYGLGAIALMGAHLRSGVLSSETAPLSALMLAPALMGMGVGLWLHDRMPQEGFRKATLAVLVIAGLNLVRRGVMG
jgi:uncharacterized membrane protein YfcA